jgi:uncharacterized membrane protein
MTKHKTLKIIMAISLVGILFSGFLSYKELFGNCDLGVINCGMKKSLVFNLPACVYGLAMYVVVFIVSFLGYKSKK